MVDVKDFKGGGQNRSGSFTKKAAIFIAVLILIILLYNTGKFFFDYIQLREIGERYTSVFFTRLITRLSVQLISFVCVFALVLLNIFLVRGNLRTAGIDRGIISTKRMSALISLFIALLLGSILSSSLYEKFLMFANPKWFGKADPVFGKDIGYYIFQRPFLASVMDSVFNICLFTAFAAAVLYWVFGCIVSERKTAQVFLLRGIAIHNYINIGILLLLNCISYIFKAEGILYGSFGELQGAGYTDRLIWLNYYRIAPFLAIVLIVAAVLLLHRGKKAAALKTVLVFPAFWIIAGIAAFAVQTLVVSPNEVIKESKSISDNISCTQDAYGLSDISEIVFNVDNNLTAEDLRESKSVTENIRILDLNANLTVLNQIQGIRNYYKFYETDIVPYEINGEKTAVAITPREITKENLSDSADTYINKTLRYTHGFGVAMNAINRVSAQGQPEFLIKDIPPKSAEGVQTVKQPRIYYGELTDDYVVVGNDKYRELDYSEGQEDIEFSYDGNGGVALTPLNRFLFAAKYADMRLLISDLVSSKSRILINRNITERLRMAAPFLRYDTDPYMVIDSDGSLKWIVDAYTATQYYPYSQNYGGFNYIRNSVKAVVDAYNGDVTFYIADKNDPIVMCYNSIYPGLFSKDDMPEGLKKYTKYPEYLFGVQSAVYGKYHISNPTAFYNKNDMWVVAKERYGTSGEEKEIAAYYNMMRLENENREELLLSIPYTLANKDNMVAWFAVRNEWDSYGKLQVYKFPKDINVYGPMQIENRINSHTEISKELNLWSQGGSKVIRGNMIVVPIKNSVMYVEPIYISSTNQSTLPELKQVVVAYNEKIAMENTLNEALFALFGESAPPEVSSGSEFRGEEKVTYEDAARKVIDEFRRVKESGANNDWSSFGDSMKALEQSVDELSESINAGNGSSVPAADSDGNGGKDTEQ